MTVRYALPTLFLCSFSITTLMGQSGMLDPDYADAGIAILQPGTVHDRGNEVVALPDGKALVCGTTNVAGGSGAFICRLLSSGSVDTSFGPDNGYQFVDLGEETYFYDMETAADGSIFVCGLSYVTYPTPIVILLKFDAQGTLDAEFGSNGIASYQFGAEEAEANALSILGDGRILLAGRVGFGGTSNGLIMRYNADGTLDTTFNNGLGWLTTTQFPGSEDLFQAMDVLSDGSIVAAGHVDQSFLYKVLIAKATPDGTWDTGFDGDGALVPDYTPEGDEAYAILAKGTEFFVGGYVYPTEDNREFFVAKFEPTGAPVSSFGNNGLATASNDQNEMVLDLALQSDGKILACGTSGSFGFLAPRDFALMRFNPNGTLDVGFGTNGMTITDVQPLFDDANGMDLQPDGKILLTGMTAGTNNDLVIARYLNDGSTAVPEPVPALRSMAIHPNPATDRIVVDNGRLLDELHVLDASGRMVLRAVRSSGPMVVSVLPAGLYQVVGTSNGRSRTTSFVKE